MSNTQNAPASVHEARQQQAQALLRVGDLALQAQDAHRAAQRTAAHAEALDGEVAALRLELVRLEGWILGAESVGNGVQDETGTGGAQNATEGA